jgi:microcystin-dependent protein
VSQPFVGEIRMGGWNFAPVGWALCQGQLLSITKYPDLYQLIGTTYGGDGISTFALPNLQGRVPMHRQADGFPIGQMAGEEQVTLNVSQVPAHSHSFNASTAAATQKTPVKYVPAAGSVDVYFPAPPTIQLNSQTISATGSGGGQPHGNMQPFQVINFIISLSGIFPTQS